MSSLKGIAGFPHLLTEADVIAHNSGVLSAPVEEFAPPDPIVEPLPVESSASSESIPPPADPAPEAPADKGEPEPPAAPPENLAAPDTGPSQEPASSGEEPASSGEEPAGDKVQEADLSDEELAAKLEKENTKASLVSMAEVADLDQSGNKSELAARLVAHYRSKK